MQDQNAEHQLPPNVSIMPPPSGPVLLHSHHPITGQSANDIRPDLARMGFIERKRAQKSFKETRKAGGQFYWRQEGGGYDRVELLNFSSVMKVQGVELRLVHNWPEDLGDVVARVTAIMNGTA